jgi:hypothetical protein
LIHFQCSHLTEQSWFGAQTVTMEEQEIPTYSLQIGTIKSNNHRSPYASV